MIHLPLPESHYFATPYTSPLAGDVRCVVLHWSASPKEAVPVEQLRFREFLSGKRGKKSVHFAILRDGTLYQSAPLDVATWHAGESAYLDPDTNTLRKGVNAFSIGIELSNVGPLYCKEGSTTLYDSYGSPHTGASAAAPNGALYEPYSPEQLVVLVDLIKTLRDSRFPILHDCRRVVGHSMISGSRKPDVGPLFPWKAFYAALDADVSADDLAAAAYNLPF